MPRGIPLSLDDGNEGGVELSQQVLGILLPFDLLREVQHKIDDKVPHAHFVLIVEDLPSHVDCVIKDGEANKSRVEVFAVKHDEVDAGPGIVVALKLVQNLVGVLYL